MFPREYIRVLFEFILQNYYKKMLPPNRISRSALQFFFRKNNKEYIRGSLFQFITPFFKTTTAATAQNILRSALLFFQKNNNNDERLYCIHSVTFIAHHILLQKKDFRKSNHFPNKNIPSKTYPKYHHRYKNRTSKIANIPLARLYYSRSKISEICIQQTNVHNVSFGQ